MLYHDDIDVTEENADTLLEKLTEVYETELDDKDLLFASVANCCDYKCYKIIVSNRSKNDYVSCYITKNYHKFVSRIISELVLLYKPFRIDVSFLFQISLEAQRWAENLGEKVFVIPSRDDECHCHCCHHE